MRQVTGEKTMPVVDPRIAGKPVPRISKEKMERECVAPRENGEAPDVGLLGQRLSGYEADNIKLVGNGGTENSWPQANVKEGGSGFSGPLGPAKACKRSGAAPPRDRGGFHPGEG